MKGKQVNNVSVSSIGKNGPEGIADAAPDTLARKY
jgi:hypothetical protein